jgi:hypothetical protein
VIDGLASATIDFTITTLRAAFGRIGEYSGHGFS